MPGPHPLVQPPTKQPDRSGSPAAAAQAPASPAAVGLRALGGYAAQAASLVRPGQGPTTAATPSPKCMTRLDQIQRASCDPDAEANSNRNATLVHFEEDLGHTINDLRADAAEIRSKGADLEAQIEVLLSGASVVDAASAEYDRKHAAAVRSEHEANLLDVLTGLGEIFGGLQALATLYQATKGVAKAAEAVSTLGGRVATAKGLVAGVKAGETFAKRHTGAQSATLQAMGALDSKVDALRALCEAGQQQAIAQAARNLAGDLRRTAGNGDWLLTRAGRVIQTDPKSPVLGDADRVVGEVDEVITAGQRRLQRLHALVAAAERGSPGAMAKGHNSRTIFDQLQREPRFARNIMIVEAVRTHVLVTSTGHAVKDETTIGHAVRPQTAEGRAWLRANDMTDNIVGNSAELTDAEADAIRPLVGVVRESTEVKLNVDSLPADETVTRAEYDADENGVVSRFRARALADATQSVRSTP